MQISYEKLVKLKHKLKSHALLAGGLKNFSHIFRRLDHNSDGVLGWDEFHSAMSRMVKLEAREVDVLRLIMDTNHDTLIDMAGM